MKNGRKATMKQMLASYRRSPSSLILRILVILAAATTAFVLLTIIGYIVMRGIPHINAGLFAWEYTTENVSMMPAIINTITMTALALALAVPIGIFSAIYLVEYARRGNRLVGLVRITAETLSGIPSIVYGLFGFLLFAISLGWGLTFLGGALTLAVMILPLVMRTTEEALIAVPDMYREGSFGLGAGKLRTVFQIVLPAAIPGILAGVILSIGRIVGETAALIFSAGTIAGVPSSLMDSGRTLSVHMYALLSEGLYMDEAYATAVVLLLLVVVINTLSAVVARAFSRR
ncbi:MAG TPA: phosphate ABC transporter permease PstA [Anaerovoracaceae bacterium]|nr:phosphate ABC transporter permease PstA [Bacillota bacterium]HRV32757.1 phosphate ABC transporter permease PstA [Anaerovoracaceae bacterium]